MKALLGILPAFRGVIARRFYDDNFLVYAVSAFSSQIFVVMLIEPIRGRAALQVGLFFNLKVDCTVAIRIGFDIAWMPRPWISLPRYSSQELFSAFCWTISHFFISRSNLIL